MVIEKSLALGVGGMLATDVQMALSGRRHAFYTVIAGLGGRAITKASLLKLFRQARADALDSVTFLDLNWEVINRQLARENATRRSGPRGGEHLERSRRAAVNESGQGAHHAVHQSSFIRPEPSRSATACSMSPTSAVQSDARAVERAELRSSRLPGLR